MDQQNIFERLKKERNIALKEIKQNPPILFQLNTNKRGTYINVIDKQSKNEIDVDYNHYEGEVRNVLAAIDNILKRNYFRIDWDQPENLVYLSENDFLFAQLQRCDNFVTTDYKPIKFAEGLSEIVFSIEGDENLNSKSYLLHNDSQIDDFLMLTGEHCLVDDTIYQINSIGSRFSILGWFNTNFLLSDQEKFLSILYSGFKNINVKYKDFQTEIGQTLDLEPTLIFEKIDKKKSLHINVGVSLPGFDVDFINQYDIEKIARVNEQEKRITICDLSYIDHHFYIDNLTKLLKKCKKGLKTIERSDFYTGNSFFIIEENLASSFIHAELSNLIKIYTIIGAEKLKEYKVHAVKPKLNVSLNHGIDFLEGDASLDIEGEQFSIFDVISQYKKSSYVMLTDGTHAIINKSYIDKLSRIFRKEEDGVKVSFFDLPIVEELIDKKVAAESFAKTREIFLGFNSLNKSTTKLPEINAKLRDYQTQGYKWLNYLHKHRLGGCLADDMGLGKTLQAITMLSKVYPDEKLTSLIVMPKSLLFNWENELEKFNASLSYYIYYGNNRDFGLAQSKNIILTTYGMVRNNIELFKEKEFYYVILDESQHIKNVNSQISKAIVLLNCKHKLALSGTPIENNLSELYSLFRFLNPSMFGTFEMFNRSYAMPIQHYTDQDITHELRKKIYPFIMRRLKRDVLKELPEKIEQPLYVEMSTSQKNFYEQRRLFYYEVVKSQISINGIKNSQFFIFQAFNELRQIASNPEAKSEGRIYSPKRELLIENVQDSVANGHKILVFTNYLNAIDNIAVDLEREKIDFLIMTGKTQDRMTLVEKFQNEPNFKVFLITLKTGGLGLNLTAADTIFIFDPWWNIAAENQAIDRAHRIGQDKTVFSYKLITKGTIEEKIIQLQEKKKELFDNIISSDSASVKSINEDDIEFILG